MALVAPPRPASPRHTKDAVDLTGNESPDERDVPSLKVLCTQAMIRAEPPKSPIMSKPEEPKAEEPEPEELSLEDTMQRIEPLSMKAAKKNGFFGYLQKDIGHFFQALTENLENGFFFADGDGETRPELEACNLRNTVLLARYAAGDLNMKPKRRRGHETNAEVVKKLLRNTPARVALEVVVLASRLSAARDECDLREANAGESEHWSNDYADEDAAEKWERRSEAIDQIMYEWEDAASAAVDKDWEELETRLESLCELDCD